MATYLALHIVLLLKLSRFTLHIAENFVSLPSSFLRHLRDTAIEIPPPRSFASWYSQPRITELLRVISPYMSRNAYWRRPPERLRSQTLGRRNQHKSMMMWPICHRHGHHELAKPKPPLLPLNPPLQLSQNFWTRKIDRHLLQSFQQYKKLAKRRNSYPTLCVILLTSRICAQCAKSLTPLSPPNRLWPPQGVETK